MFCFDICLLQHVINDNPTNNPTFYHKFAFYWKKIQNSGKMILTENIIEAHIFVKKDVKMGFI